MEGFQSFSWFKPIHLKCLALCVTVKMNETNCFIRCLYPIAYVG